MRLRLGVIATLLVCAAPACGGAGQRPPAGLTAYGGVVWNLDALLHDTFGKHRVWEDYGKRNIPNFSTKFLGLARSVPYAYTFSNARHSTYRPLHVERPPAIADFVTGYDAPLMINGAYISCGRGLWLYEHNGQALPGGNLSCAPSHR